MHELDQILRLLDERELMRAVGSKHDDERLRYQPASLTVGSFAEFERAIGDYYANHFQECVATGAKLPDFEAKQRAKAIIEAAYREKGGTIAEAFTDASDGLNGGMRHMFDLIADSLKQESVRNYVESVIDRYVTPVSHDEKVEIIKQLIALLPENYRGGIDTKHPERYAHDYKQIIQAFVRIRRDAVRPFRRL